MCFSMIGCVELYIKSINNLTFLCHTRLLKISGITFHLHYIYVLLGFIRGITVLTLIYVSSAHSKFFFLNVLQRRQFENYKLCARSISLKEKVYFCSHTLSPEIKPHNHTHKNISTSYLVTNHFVQHSNDIQSAIPYFFSIFS